MYIESKKVQCRNCDHEQYYNVVNGNTPNLNESIAVCNNCGFKSIWYNRKIKLSDDEVERIKQLLTDNISVWRS